jgi:hypothetical protein
MSRRTQMALYSPNFSTDLSTNSPKANSIPNLLLHFYARTTFLFRIVRLLKTDFVIILHPILSPYPLTTNTLSPTFRTIISTPKTHLP